MGYSTDFEGQFDIDKALDDETFNLMHLLSNTRRMMRKGLPEKYGVDGEFYGGDEKCLGQNQEDNIVDYNEPPSTQPGLWCQWEVTEDRLHIQWNGTEKFYDYITWIEYLINKVLSPKGYKVNGEVLWFGEDNKDRGKITIKNNKVSTQKGKVSFSFKGKSKPKKTDREKIADLDEKIKKLEAKKRILQKMK